MTFEPRSPAELDEVLRTLRASLARCSAARKAERQGEIAVLRETFHGKLALAPARYLEWAEDVVDAEEAAKILEAATSEYPGHVELWLRRVEHMATVDLGDAGAVAARRRLHDESCRVAGQHLRCGVALWRSFVEFEVQVASAAADLEALGRVADVVMRQLRAPLHGNEEALAHYTELLGDALPMEELEKMLKGSQAAATLRQPWEMKLEKMAAAGDVDELARTWLAYARWEGCATPGPKAKPKPDPENIWRAAALLERALAICPGDANDADVETHSARDQVAVNGVPLLWTELYYIHRDATLAATAANRGLRRCLNSEDLWKARLLALRTPELAPLLPGVLRDSMATTLSSAEAYLDLMLCAAAGARSALASVVAQLRDGDGAGTISKAQAKATMKPAVLRLREIYRIALDVLDAYYPAWHAGYVGVLVDMTESEFTWGRALGASGAFEAAYEGWNRLLKSKLSLHAGAWTAAVEALTPLCLDVQEAELFKGDELGLEERATEGDDDDDDDEDDEDEDSDAVEVWPWGRVARKEMRLRMLRGMWKRAVDAVKDDPAGVGRAWGRWELRHGGMEELRSTRWKLAGKQAAMEKRAQAYARYLAAQYAMEPVAAAPGAFTPVSDAATGNPSHQGRKGAEEVGARDEKKATKKRKRETAAPETLWSAGDGGDASAAAKKLKGQPVAEAEARTGEGGEGGAQDVQPGGETRAGDRRVLRSPDKLVGDNASAAMDVADMGTFSEGAAASKASAATQDAAAVARPAHGIEKATDAASAPAGGGRGAQEEPRAPAAAPRPVDATAARAAKPEAGPQANPYLSQAPLRKRPQPTSGAPDPLRVFILNLPFDATEEDLTPVFAAYGSVADVDMVKRRGKPRGMAFVRFATAEEATAAMAANGVNVKGRALKVRPAMQTPSFEEALVKVHSDAAAARGPGHVATGAERTVFVSHLGATVTAADVAEFFGACGPVAHAKIIVNKETQESKGCALVQFAEAASVPRALAKRGSRAGVADADRAIMVKKSKFAIVPLPSDAPPPSESNPEENRNPPAPLGFAPRALRRAGKKKLS